MGTDVLLTGFEPFGGARVNASWEAVSRLAGRPAAGGGRLVAAQLPCVYGAALAALREAVLATEPALVVAVGEAGGCRAVTLERVAVNVDHSQAPDNAGARPAGRPVVAGGPARYRTGLPVRPALRALRAAGIPAAASRSAGTFVCNHVFYGLMHLAGTDRPGLRAGFVHVPRLREQGTGEPGQSGLSADTVAAALEVVVATSLRAKPLRHRTTGANP